MDISHRINCLIFKIKLEKSSLISAIIDTFVKGTPFNLVDYVILWSLNLDVVIVWCLFLFSCLKYFLEIMNSQVALSVSIFIGSDQVLITKTHLYLFAVRSGNWKMSNHVSSLDVINFNT